MAKVSQIPNLENSPLNLKSLREQSQRELVNILKNIRGKKCLIIDPKLSGSLSLIIQTSILVEYGVELRHLSADPIQTDTTKIVYLVRSQFELMKYISSNVHDDISKGLQREYYVYFVPRREVVCEKVLEEEKVHHLMTIGEYPLYMVPFDEDVISFELDGANKDFQVDGNTSSLWHIAKAIHKLEFLNFSDKLFKETRDLNFEVVVQVLRQKATSMKEDYAEMTTTNQSVSELKDFVKKLNSLPEMTQLTTFTSKQSFLARLNMEHTIVEAESYDMRELLHSYGFEHIATLNNLEKAGLLKKQESRSNWLTIKRALQLVVEDTDTANPNDIAYVFSGYAPLSIRLVQHAIRSGWRPMEEILRMLPGPHSETKRGGFPHSASFESMSALGSRVADGRRSLVLVVFIGGVTFAEIAALRFLSAQEGMAYDLMIATTKMISGNSLTESYVEKLG
ncbi:Vacuolar protein-sorting-associated protein 33 homolog [Linum grandiflorum]